MGVIAHFILRLSQAEVPGQGFLADDMLAGFGRIQHHRKMESIGDDQVNDLNGFILQ